MRVVTRDNGYEKLEAQGLTAAEAERLADRGRRGRFTANDTGPEGS